MDAQLRQETTILLLGQKQSGKSDVGNAILGMKAFNRSSSRESVILPASAEIDTETKEYELMLVDGPDLEDIDLKKLQGSEGTCDKLGLAMGLCEKGVDVFVLVLEYGVPLTEDHKAVIEASGEMLGGEWLSNNGIVVMCGGKDWKRENKDISFEQWCKYQNDTYGNIFSKCGYRCVLFENSEPDKEHKQKLFEDLMYWAEQIRENYGRHTNEHFEAAARNRDKLIAKLNAPILHIKIQKRTSLLTSKCMKLYDNLTYTEKMKLIGVILDRAKRVLKDIAKENKYDGTSKLTDLKKQVMDLRERAHQAEKVLRESPNAILSDFIGIKESAYLVESIRTDPELWISLTKAALLGLTVCTGSAIATGFLVAAAGAPLAPAVAIVGATAGVSGVLAGVVKYRCERKRLDAHKFSILLLGKDLSSKAVVGNAILGMEAFNRSTTGNSLLPAWAEIDTDTDEYELMVVNGPAVNDINLENLTLAMGFCGTGVDLFVLVMKYDDRFTKKEISMLHALKNKLGPKWLSRHGVVVMTYGGTSCYEMKRVSRSKDFTRWCSNNDASYGKFFSECNNRCFLFDTEKPDTLQKQILCLELIAVAKKVKYIYGPSKNEHFKTAAENRDNLLASLNAPILDMKIQKKISILKSQCTKLSNKLPRGDKMKLIGAVIDRTNGLLKDIAIVDKRTGKLNELREQVTKLKEQAEQDERRLQESPEEILGDFMDMQAIAEVLEKLRTNATPWEEFQCAAFEGVEMCKEAVIAMGLILYEAGFRVATFFR